MNLRGVVMVAISAAVALAAGCATPGGRTEARPGQSAQTFTAQVTAQVGLKYLLYLPEDYGKTPRQWPLVLFLHGSGERGDDVQLVAKHGPPKLVKEGKQFPFVIVSPQCPEWEWWTSGTQLAALSALLDDIVARYHIDQDRIYVTGLSMGGFATWQLAFEYPHRFAAIAPICGKGDPAKAARIKHLPAWVFHGAKDPTVPLSGSQEMVDALKQYDSDVKFTVYPEALHDSWTETYNNPELYDWFLKHQRK